MLITSVFAVFVILQDPVIPVTLTITYIDFITFYSYSLTTAGVVVSPLSETFHTNPVSTHL